MFGKSLHKKRNHNRKSAQFLWHLGIYLAFLILMIFVNLSIEKVPNFQLVAFGWGIGVCAHYLRDFGWDHSGFLLFEQEEAEQEQTRHYLEPPKEELILKTPVKRWKDSDLV